MKYDRPLEQANDISLVFMDRKMYRWPFIIAAFCAFIWALFSPNISFGIFTALWLVIGVVTWIISRRGFPRLSSNIVLIAAWVLVTSFAIYWPMLRQVLPSIYLLLFIIGLQVYNLLGIGVFILSIITQFCLALLEQQEMLGPVPASIDPLSHVMFNSVVMALGFIFIYSVKVNTTENVEAVGNLAQRFQALFHNANDAVIFIDFNFRVLGNNQKAADLLGRTSEELKGMSVRHISVTDDFRRDVRLFQAIAGGKPIPLLERQARRKDGSLIDVELSAILVRDTAGNPLYIQCIVRDITERNRIMHDLMEYQQRYQALFNRTGETIFITSFDLVIMSANPQAYQLLNYQPPKLTGTPLTELVCDDEDLEKLYITRDSLLRGETVPHHELNMRRSDGQDITVEISSAVVYDTAGKPIYIQNFARDITTHRTTEEQLKTSLNEMVVLAATDTLTGINNRRTIEEYAENLIKRAEAKQLPFSVALIDMDNLKSINDQYGHIAGDQALQHLANLMVANKRITDMLGRWAGDEFLLLLPDTSRRYAYNMATRLHENVGETPLTLETGEQLTIGISIGVAGIEPDGTTHYLLEKLLNEADIAMYQAKAAGRNQVILSNS